MNDPFDTRAVNRQLLREAKIGLAMIVLLGGFFTYVGYFRMGNFRSQLPAHIIEAPLATNVGQNYHNKFRPVEEETHASDRANDELVSRAVVPEERPVRKNPFQLPNAVRTIGERLGSSFTGSRDSNTPKPKPNTEKPPRVAARPAVLDSSSGQGPIPVGKLKSFSPNRQNEFDIARSGPDGKPQPFKSTALREETAKSVTPAQDNGEFVAPPKVRTARETSVTDKDQSGVQRPSSDFSTGGVVSSSWDSPFEASETDAPVDTTETLNASSFNNKQPSKPIPSAFSKPTNVASPGAPEPDDTVLPRSLDGAVRAPGKQSFEVHVVKAGDSFWSLSQTYLADGRFFRALFEHNRPSGVEFEKLVNGKSLEIPTAEYLIRRYPNLVPADRKRPVLAPDTTTEGDWYVTQTGETLFGIAKENYGQASRYLDILKANQSRLPENVQHMSRLPAGLQLNLPR